MTTPTIELFPHRIAVMHLHGINKIDEASVKEIGELLQSYASAHAQNGNILIIDLDPIDALHVTVPRWADASGKAFGFSAAQALFEFSAGLEQHNIGCIYANLKPVLEGALETAGYAKHLTFAATSEDAMGIAAMLQENPQAKADWLMSAAPGPLVESLILRNEIPPIEEVNKGTFRMELPWPSLHSGHISALEKKLGDFVEARKKVGEKRTLIIDLSGAVETSMLLMPALARVKKALNTRGDSLRIVCTDAMIESMIDENPKTRSIPIFTNVREACRQAAEGVRP